MAKKYWWEEENQQDNAQKSEAKSHWWEDNSVSSTVGENIANRVNTWLKNHNTYISNYQTRNSGRKYNYEDSYVSDSADWLNTVSQQKSAFDAEADSILSYMDQYKDYLNADWMAQVRKTLTDARGAQDIVLGNTRKDNEWWSSFGSEEMLKAHGSAEEAYKYYQWDDGLKKKYTGATGDDIQKALASLGVGEERDWLRINQGKIFGDSIRENTDFQDYVTTGSSLSYDDFGTETMRRGTSRRMRSTTTIDKYRAASLALAEHYGNEAPLGIYDKYDEEVAIFRTMKDEEFENLAYCIAYDKQNGTKTAEQYVNFMEETLSARRGTDIGEKITGIDIPIIEDLAVLGYGALAGVDNFAFGIEQFMSDDEVAYYPSYYANAHIADSLDGLGYYAHSAATNIGNMAPSILVSGVVSGLGVPRKVSEAIGSTTMGVSAAGSAYKEALAKGYDKESARTYSNLVGASEGLLQYLIGGVSKLGGVSNIFSKLAGKISLIDDALLRGAAKYGMSIGSEVFEEEIQNFLEPAFRSIIFGEDYDAPTINEMIETAIVTALSTSVLEGGSTYTGIKEDMALDKQAAKDYGDKTDALIQEGLQNDVKSVSYKLAQKYQQQTQGKDGKNGKAMTGAQIRNLLAANQAEVTKADLVKIQDAAANRLAQVGQREDIYKIAELATKYATGQEMTRAERSTLARSNFGSQVASEMLNGIHPDKLLSNWENNMSEESGAEYSTDWTGEIGTESDQFIRYNNKKLARAIFEHLANSVVEDPASYKSLESRVEAEEPAQVSDTGKSVIRGTDQEIDLTKPTFKEITKEGAVLDVDGEPVSANNIDYADEDIGYAIRSVGKIENITPEAAGAVVSLVDMSKPVVAQMNAMDEAFTYGYNNYSVEDLKAGLFTKNLTDAQLNDAYKLGQYVRGKSVVDADAPVVKMRTAADAKLTAEQKTAQQKARIESKDVEVYFKDGGTVVKFDEHTGKYDPKRMAAVNTAKFLSKLKIGGKYYFFESYLSKTLKDEEGNALRVYKDADGNEVKAPNGMYMDSDGSIHIDLNAGNAGNGAALFTLGHELTHFVKGQSKKQFKILGDLVKEAFDKTNLSMHQRVLEKQRFLESVRRDENGNKVSISYEEAYEEVVADAMSTMLTDGTFHEKLMEIKVKDKGLFNTIKRFFEKMIAKFRNVYEELTPDQQDAQDIRELKDMFDKIQTAFAEALVEASENFQAAMESVVEANAEPMSADEIITEGAVVTDGEGVRHSIRSMKHDIAEGKMFEDLKKVCGWTDAQVNTLRNQLKDLVEYMIPYRNILDMNETYGAEGRRFSPYKPNSDPLYKISMDFSTLCSKRLLTQYVIEQLQLRENRPMSAEEQMAIRDMLNEYRKVEKGLQVACAMCYVEAARLKSPKQVQRWLDDPAPLLKDYFGKKNKAFNDSVKKAQADYKESKGYDREAPKKDMKPADVNELNKIGPKMRSQYQLSAEEQEIVERAKSLPNSTYLTAANLANLSETDPVIYDAYTAFVRTATRSKSLEKDEPYYYGDSTRDNGNGIVVTDSFIEAVNKENGMRFSSWSDWRIQHLLDYITAVIDNSVRGAAMHGYTKFGDEVRVLGKTGMMFNMSGVAGTQTGLNEDGSLSFSQTESIDVNEAIQLREEFPEHAGLQCIGVSDEHIVALLRSDIIDYVIPYHVSGLNAVLRRMVNIYGWADYTGTQHASINKSIKFENAVDKEHWHEEPVFSEFFVGYDTGMTGIEAMRASAEKYKQMCKDRGLTPKFDQFATEDNYWKLLIDRKMINQQTGQLIRQKAVTPTFDFDVIKGVVDKFVDNYDAGLEARALNHVVDNWDSIPQRIKDLKKQGGTKAKKTKKAVNTLANQTVAAQPKDGVKNSDRTELSSSEYNRLTSKKPINVTKQEFAMIKTQRKSKYSSLEESEIPIIDFFRIGDYRIINNGFIYYIRNSGSDSFSVVMKKKIVPDARRITREVIEDENRRNDATTDPSAGQERGERGSDRSSGERTGNGRELSENDRGNVQSGESQRDLHAGQGDADSGTVRLSERNNAPTFYSQMGKVVEGMKQEKFGASSVISMLRGRGVKAEEIRWSGIQAFLDGKKSVTKQELLDFIKGSMLQIEEQERNNTKKYSPEQHERLLELETEIDYAWDEIFELWEKEFGEDLPMDLVVATFVERRVKKIIDTASKEAGVEISEDSKRIIQLASLIDRNKEEQESISYQAESQEPKWGQFKLDGGENYRELLFKLPDSTYSNTAMKGHWGEDAKGILAHARMQDFEVNGKKMLFIEEIQSDWHNAGAKNGYGDLDAEKARIDAEYDERLVELAKWQDKLDAYNERGEEGEYPEDYDDVYDAYMSASARVEDSERRILDMEHGYHSIAQDAPFKSNYHEYVLKRLIRMAAEEGYDSIGWTTADIQSDRWSDEYAEGYRIEYDQDIPKFLKKYGKQWGAEVGKTKITTGELSDWETDMIEQGLIEVQLPTNVVWSMDITPAMKKSVLTEGQAMYSERGDSTSNRHLLANAFEGLSRSSAEYKMIQDYKEQINVLNLLDEQLSDLNAEIREIRFTKGKYDAEKLRKIEEKAERIARDIDKQDKVLIRMEASEPLRKIIAFERKKAAQKAKDHVNEIQQNKKVRAEQTELRHKIRKAIRDLDKILKHGNKQKNVKEDLLPVVTKALQSADILFTDNYGTYDMLRNGIGADLSDSEEALVKTCTRMLKDLDKMPTDGYDNFQARQEAEKRLNIQMSKLKEVFARERKRLNNTTVSSILGELADAYASLEKSEQSYVQGAYTEAVHNFLKSLQSEVGGTIVKDMTKDQLEYVYAAYKMVLTTVRKANVMFNKELKMSREQLGNAVIQEVMNAGGVHGLWTKAELAASKADWNNMKPIWVANRIGSDTFGMLMKGLFEGQYNFAVDVEEAKQFKLSMDEKYKPRSWDAEKLYEFESSTGKKFSLNLQQIMSLYAFSKREQAYSHLLNGGFVFEGNSTVIVDEKGRKKTYIHNGATSYKLNEATLNGIINSLTKEQKAYVDEMQKYLSEVMGAKGNEVSMQLYGIKMFKEQFYFPLRSSGAYMERAKEEEMKKQQGQINLVNSGFTHAVKPEAKNPIILSGFMDVWAEHCNEMSMYHSMVLPMEDFRKVYNYSTVHDDKFDSASVFQTIQDAYGDAATAYIDQLYRELNAGATIDPRETTFKKLISNFKKTAVMLSASVVVQQFSSIGRAYALIDPKYFIGTRVNSDTQLSVVEEMRKYAPVAIIKEMGGFDTGTKGSAKSYIMAEKYGKGEWLQGLKKDEQYRSDLMGILPAKADEKTWCAIWEAVKRETKAKHPRMDVKSEEFLKLAGERFSEVIEKTQVYDSVLARSANMRSKTGLMQMATSFMAEPTTTVNLLEDAIRRGDKKHMARAFGAVAVSIVLNNALASIVYAMRDDDEDETFIEKYFQSFTSGMIDDINPMSYYPFLKDVYSMFQGYDVERTDMSVFGNLRDSMKQVLKYLIEDTSEMDDDELTKHYKHLWGAFGSLLDAGCSVFGVPLKNVRRDANGIINAFSTISKDLTERDTSWNSFWDKVGAAVKDTIPGYALVAKDKAKADKLYEAIVSGDKAYLARLKSTYKTDSAYQSAVRKALRENDSRIHEAAQAGYEGNRDERNRIFQEIKKEGKFAPSEIIDAINSELSAIRNKLEPEKVTSQYDASTFVDAVSLGDTKTAMAMREDIISSYVANGKTQEEAEKTFEDSVLRSIQEAFSVGLLDEAGAENMLMEYAGKDEEEAASKVNYWAFCEEHPQYELTESNVADYQEFAEPAEISLDVFVQYINGTKGISTKYDQWGDVELTVREQVLEVIDSLPLTWQQKDALYLAAGYSESKIWDVPW